MNKALTGAKIFFFISGFTALVYEVIWLRLLGLVFGNTTFAVSTVLAAYMAGLGFGSYFLSAMAERWKRPLRSYGLLELAVGLYAAATPWLVLAIQWAYVSFGRAYLPSDGASVALRLFLSFFIVFVPTFFMGGTLPVLIKFFLNSEKSVGVTTAQLYGLNTAGALCGTLATGVILLPVLGLNTTLAIAVLLNLGIGAMAILLSAQMETEKDNSPKKPAFVSMPALSRLWLGIAVFISGTTAMMYEVSWTRILAAVLGSSTYAFTVMLGTFLLGLTLGSVAWTKVLRRHPASGRQWGWLCLGISACALFALPFFPWVNLAVVRLYGLTIGHPGWLFFMMGMLCMLFMTLPAFFFGALFPVSAALFAGNGEEASQKVGRLYFWNTLGNITGSLGAGFLLIPTIGIHDTLRVAIFSGAALAAVASLAAEKKRLNNSILFILSVSTMISVLGIESGWNKHLVCAGLNYRAPSMVALKTQNILAETFSHDILYYREGLNCIVNVGQVNDVRYLKVNGKVDASTSGDMSTQLLAGHLPHLLHPDPKRSLVIGFGSGVTLAAALAHPVSQVDCPEIEPAVVKSAPFFERVNRRADQDARARILLNDGRNHLLLHKEKYDVIISEPSNPWISGISFLFTTDFYRLAESRLNERGVFCQWVNGYAIRPEDFWMVVASVKSVFGHVSIWRGTPGDFLIIAQREPFVYDLEGIEKRFQSLPQVQKDLALYNIRGAAGLLARYQLGEGTIQKYITDSPLHTDDRLSLEFSSPMALYDDDDRIKDDIARLANKEAWPALSGGSDVLAKNADYLTQIGEAILNMQKPELARDYFERALALEPQKPDALAGMGFSLGLLGRTFQANEYLEKAGTADAFASLAKVRMKDGDETAALKWIQKACEFKPGDRDNFYLKGQILEGRRDWAGALEAYQQSRRLSHKSLDIDFAVARVRRELGEVEGSIYELEALRKQYPAYFPVYSELNKAYQTVDRPAQAIAAYESFVGLNPYVKQGWVDLMALYLKTGKQEKLEEVLKRTSELSLV